MSTPDPALLERLALFHVKPDPAFAIPDRVWALVEALPTPIATRGEQEHACCAHCDQSYAVLARGGVPYTYDDGELDGLYLAHLIQAHGWSREGPA